MFTKWLKNFRWMNTRVEKNFRWMNTRVEKGFFEEKMANLKVLLQMFAKHIVDSTSFTKTVKFSIEICGKYVVLVFGEIFIIPPHFAKHACDFSLILLERCNFLH